MGTLTSCSFSTGTLRFRPAPIAGAFRGRFQLLDHRNPKNLCFLCRKKSKGKNSFGVIRCFSSNNGRDGDNDSSNDSNLKMAPLEEAEERLSSGGNSQEKAPVSVSSRVPLFCTISLFVCLVIGFSLYLTSTF